MNTPTMSGSPTLVGRSEAFLREVIETLEPVPEPVGRGRPRTLPSLCLWAGLIVCILRGLSSQLSLWRLLAHKGLWDYPRFAVCDQAVYNRLAREGASPLREFFEHLSELLRLRLSAWAEPQALCGFASGVVALDETTLDKMARRFSTLKERPLGEALAGTLSGLYDVRLQQWRRILYRCDTRSNEKQRARAMVEGLAAGTLVLADLGYFGFAWFDDLTDQGYYWLSRMRARTSYSPVHVYAEGEHFLDAVVWLGKHRADRAAHAVRLVRFRVAGREHAYVTNVLDPKLFPAEEIARAYARRWDFELAVALVKRELGLRLIWSSKPAVIEAQVWAVLTVAQVLSALRYEVALRSGADVFEVSMPLLVRWMPVFAADGEDPVEAFVTRGRAAGFIRASRRIRVEVFRPPGLEERPLPEEVALTRTPRHAQRKCEPRARIGN
jgi:hypothetical protein